ncbi:mannitol dehydrogenase family protein [Croceivirga thetidis]|uniref:Mannitol dehydrogenase family protein n=1 Tax=Croceivirga thetidis TaxID=2721623 RepID=A0ABX1GQ34_9FLAO|nr:mannitol dehydrogenase family protein [Croceivirga thetidis]NKI31739.1 mannitol dehydrogenase family protein [Croceivirga thetidis]
MILNEKNLSAIGASLPIPKYKRSTLKTGIVHIGVGGFHRSHQAFYLHRLIQENTESDWGICGVGLREADRNMFNVLNRQDGLYTLITQHPNGTTENEIIGSISEYLLAVDTPQEVIEKMAHPNTKIVSLTITEGGYNFNATTGEFNFENPDVRHELAHPEEPKTVYGYLTSALRKRRSNSLPPFTIMSCDNIQHNGTIARKMLLAFAKKQDSELADWIEKEVAFPNSMVDRITPVTTQEVISDLKDVHNLEDQWPVVCEPFIQWVVEDNFSNGRPPLEKVGVQFVSDVTPYEKMKIRLLNAGHSVLGIPGAIHGHLTINDCINDKVFAVFMRHFMDEEVTPILGEIEGIDIEKYKDTLTERFSNPNIKDGVSRICSESSAKLPKFLIPTIEENLKTRGQIKCATFILAAWCYYSDMGKNENGLSLEIIDSQKEQLQKAANRTEANWTAFLNLQDIFGKLTDSQRFVSEYTTAVQLIYKRKNIRALMKELLGSSF